MVRPSVTLILCCPKCGRGKDFPDRKSIAQHMVFHVECSQIECQTRSMFEAKRRVVGFALSKIRRSDPRMQITSCDPDRLFIGCFSGQFGRVHRPHQLREPTTPCQLCDSKGYLLVMISLTLS
jgi:hypothetical protein